MTEDTSRAGPERGKSVLICPACDHESPADGDWDVSDDREGRRERRVYTCPDCGETITSRPVFALSTA